MDHATHPQGNPPSPPANPRTTIVRRFFQWTFSLLAWGVLGFTFWWGHHHGWALPEFSTAQATPADWCEEHAVPESICIECNDALDPKAKPVGFCTEHGVAECVSCNPKLAQVTGEPQRPRYDVVAALKLRPRPTNNSRSTLHLSRVQFASTKAIEQTGIDVDLVQESPMDEVLTAPGEINFAPTGVAHLSSRVSGTVAAVFKTLGDRVDAGDVLALIDSADVGQAKTNLVRSVVQAQLAETHLERIRQAGQAVTGRALLDADADLKTARIELVANRQDLANLGFEIPENLEGSNAERLMEDLRLLGLSEAQVRALPSSMPATANLIPIRSPLGGIVVDAEIVVGEVVDTAKMLYEVADTSKMWLELQVNLEQADLVRLGLPVRCQSDDGQLQAQGTVDWISPKVDERTRTLPVRVVLDNRDGRLRDETYVTGTFLLRHEPYAVVVPKEAVQSTTDAQFVFVRDRRYFEEGSPKVFHVRQVRTGASDDRVIEILAGVLPGEVVATKGSNVLLSQLLRSNLGAGCGCHE